MHDPEVYLLDYVPPELRIEVRWLVDRQRTVEAAVSRALPDAHPPTCLMPTCRSCLTRRSRGRLWWALPTAWLQRLTCPSRCRALLPLLLLVLCCCHASQARSLCSPARGCSRQPHLITSALVPPSCLPTQAGPAAQAAAAGADDEHCAWSGQGVSAAGGWRGEAWRSEGQWRPC